jgi:hypothetical protein
VLSAERTIEGQHQARAHQRKSPEGAVGRWRKPRHKPPPLWPAATASVTTALRVLAQTQRQRQNKGKPITTPSAVNFQQAPFGAGSAAA